MHILLVPSWYPRSASDISGIFFRDQALALQSYGHEVGIVAAQMRSLRTLFSHSSRIVPPYYEVDLGLRTYRREVLAALPRVPYGNYLLYKRATYQLFREYINVHGLPDILHAHASIYGGAASAELALEFNIPLVLTEHSTGFARHIYSDWQLQLAARAINASECCISVSPSLGDLLDEQFSSNGRRWRWIPNVVAERFKIPHGFCCEDRPIRFLNLALMTEKKGQLDLIEAFDGVIQSGFNAELLLAGDGPIRAKLERRVLEFGICKRVRFLGLVDPSKVPHLLEKADVMVVSSHYETFGVVAAEALMAGLPVIATRCGGPECIVGPNDGLLVPPKQPAALERAMKEFCTSLPNYDRAEIAKRAEARFSGLAVAKSLTREYDRVLSSRSPTDLAG